MVGEGGRRLTATQAQQLALARIALADPAIAILRGRTALVIAHRLSQAEASDRIVVLDAGRVVEQGTHHELLRRGGRYAELWVVSGRADHRR